MFQLMSGRHIISKFTLSHYSPIDDFLMTVNICWLLLLLFDMPSLSLLPPAQFLLLSLIVCVTW